MAAHDDIVSAKADKREYMRLWRERNRDHIKAYQAAWRDKNSAHVAGYQKTYHADYRAQDATKYAYWERNLRRNYKMTPDCFNALWNKQGGACAVCGIPMKPRGRSAEAVAVDHNHATGEVRGLLCRGCNHGIGHLRDDPDILISAAEYLIDRGHYAHFEKD